MGANTVEITDANFETEVLQSSIPVLVEFWTAWCAPCRTMAPTIDEIAQEYKGRVKVGRLNADEQQGICQQFDVRTVPTLIVFKDGQVQEKLLGFADKARITKALIPYL